MNDLHLIQQRLRQAAQNPAADPSEALAHLQPDGSFSGVEYFIL